MQTDTACQELLARVAADRWGQVAVGLYDTARLVALAPWLPGHRARVAYLCRQQDAGGEWGGPGGYALVPTLSATAALLAELRRSGPGRADGLAGAVTEGVRALHGWLGPGARPEPVPDTIGVELIVPALLEELTALAGPAGEASPAVGVGAAGEAGPAAPVGRLRLPAGFDPRVLVAARQRFADRALSRKSWACLEVLGPAAAGARFVRPAGGSVGCSAAATAAWLGDRPAPGCPPAYRTAGGFLAALQARGGGPVPGVTPITYFEAAWVLNSLALAGMTGPPGPAPAAAPGPAPVPVPAAVLDRLEAGLADDGAPAAPGLPPDADDTAAVLAALLRHGRPRSPDRLLRYRTAAATDGGYFTCFPDERTPSVSTNAHVLETLALYLAYRPEQQSRYAGPAATAAGWLLGQQRPDGSWWDKWHASGYYPTGRCALALARYGGPGAGEAVARARAWVRDTQRPDGSWGRWQGTVEETAYAVQLLALAPPGPGPAERAALDRGCRFLADPPPLTEHPPLWHAKDLYLPVTVVQAARLAALHLARRVGASLRDSEHL